VDFQAFDSAYVEKLRAGDRATEDHFIAYFGELIDLKLRSRLPSRQAIEDVKQETFARCLQLLRSASGVRNAERLGPLVNSICNHVLSESH
jgi:RNA polymerase sigma-70 factor (ECF subfamily)